MAATRHLSPSASTVAPRPIIWQGVAAGIEGILYKLFNAPPTRGEVLELKGELQRVAILDADIGEDAEALVQYRADLDAEKVFFAGGSQGFGRFERLFQQIRAAKMHGAPMPNVDFDQLATEMNPMYGYGTPRQYFRPARYRSFEDWFLRELAEGTRVQCLARAAKASISAPVQGRVLERALSNDVRGKLTLKISVIAVDQLLQLVEGHQLIQFGLRKTDYHRVHSPVDGVIDCISAYGKDQLFPGSEAMTVIEIRCTFGTVKLLCIGEWSVQSFVIHSQVVGPSVQIRKMDELGHFDFGSQVLLVLPASVKLLSRGGDRVFPGDPVGSVSFSTHGSCNDQDASWIVPKGSQVRSKFFKR